MRCASWCVLPAAAALVSFALGAARADAAAKPNVVVILTDDMGYADVGFNGCKDIPTPNIDRIARQGLRFTQGYVSHPFCSPTRAGLMTGRYQQRFGHENNPKYDPDDESYGLPTGEILLPQVLQEAGYATGLIGKWHLGAHPKFHPMRRGFTEMYGFLGGGHDYFQTELAGDPKEYLIPIRRDGKPEAFEGYLTDALSREAAAFVQRRAGEPFFLYLAYNAPHTPLQAPEEYLSRFPSIEDSKRRTYAAMVSAVDDGVGRLLAALQQAGLDERTLIFFFSDNGGPIGPRSNGSDNAPLRDGKGSVYEGGIRVPFAMQWTGTLPAGKEYDHPVVSLDVFPTAVALAGAKLPEGRVIDGVNLMPYLLGEKQGPPHDVLFWRSGGGSAAAVRSGDAKLLRSETGAWQAYDLKSDIGEGNDLAGEMPAAAAELQKMYEQWNAQLVPPVFEALRDPRPKRKSEPAPPSAARRPNVLLVVSEDNGPELGCYGDPYARTPNLDRLAGEGVRFDNAFVPYAICSPSRAAFLTGLYPHQNGQIGLATHKFAMYRPDTPNVVTLLKSAGYRTGLIGKLHVNPQSAFPFDFRAIPGANFNREIDVADYAAAAAGFFAAAGDQPFFLSVNFPDAHLPFVRQAHGRPAATIEADAVKPMPWVGVDSPRIRQQVADYYNCLARLDEGVGLLLSELEKTGQAGRTIVFYIGDHGAQFPRGKGTVYEGALHVPLIVRWPGAAEAGHSRNELVSTLDILPTVLAAAGMESAAASLPGRALQPLLRREPSPPWRECVFGLTTGSFPGACFVQHSVRDSRFKLICSPRPHTENLDAATYLDPRHPNYVVSGATLDEQAAAPPLVRDAFARWSRPPRYELYDLSRDPNEWRDLADDPQYGDVKARLIAALRDWQVQTRDPFLDQANVDSYVEEQLANRDLGYRKRADFRWKYLETFPRWREGR